MMFVIQEGLILKKKKKKEEFKRVDFVASFKTKVKESYHRNFVNFEYNF